MANCASAEFNDRDQQEIDDSFQMLREEEIEREFDYMSGRISLHEYEMLVRCAQAKFVALRNFAIARHDRVERERGQSMPPDFESN